MPDYVVTLHTKDGRILGQFTGDLHFDLTTLLDRKHR